MIALSDFLILGAVIFCMGVAGVLFKRKNIINVLMAIELMLLAVNTNFVAFSHYLGDTAGQIFVFFILVVAAAEAAIGLAIVVLLFRNRRTIDVADWTELKGCPVGAMVIMMTIMMKNNLFLCCMTDNPANNFAAFSLAEMNRMATWNH
jgi:NADH-quinone oxidoreductase subunit K